MTYEDNWILHGFTFHIEEGEWLIPMEPSECEETPLFRLIAGFLSPDSGEIFLEDRPVSRDGVILVPRERRNLGFVLQDLALWPHFTPAGNLAFGLKARGIPSKERQKRVRKMIHLSDLMAWKIANPATSRVDSGGTEKGEIRAHPWEQVTELQMRFGFTLIYVTHDREEMKEVRTRVIESQSGLAFSLSS